MELFRKIDFWLSRQLFVLSKHLDYRKEEIFNIHLAKLLGIERKYIHFSQPAYFIGQEYMDFRGRFYASPGARIECFSHYAGEKFKP